MSFRLITIGSLFSAVLFFGFGSRVVFGDHDDNDELDCHTYTDAHSPTATCNGMYKCAGGCSGYVTASKCISSQQPNASNAPTTTEKCTIGYGKTSANTAICINEKGSFSCTGSADGKAECNGCTPDLNHASPSSSTTTHPADTSNGGSNTVPVVETSAPHGPPHSAGSFMGINIFHLFLSTLISAIFL
ncbi:hypothetical protein PCANC_04136 [Puccinia coronata f. sp. avenae]|uniref:Secreted protein n=1 Tax=Puccinia coronata f. sp. avenae TaxID=200324 RepID=A0A2N5VGB0_9BASI|nr:hypothetical protein PCANC_28055 [Puccinia coronata f. sp. avenae]PLW49029.1 hypothetical protein PCASD_05076 [Puccinia coronata f. sp. avenae]PLW58100.1 hypothetical protein PCANC_04136 [Puccinia coronata f. sp. avenae]